MFKEFEAVRLVINTMRFLKLHNRNIRIQKSICYNDLTKMANAQMNADRIYTRINIMHALYKNCNRNY